MSILIKNMEMPTDNNAVSIIIFPNGKVSLAHDHRYAEYAEAVSVPPHGRLIDVDAFIEKCKEMAGKEDGNQLDALVLLEWFLEQNAPTIIQAEVK